MGRERRRRAHSSEEEISVESKTSNDSIDIGYKLKGSEDEDDEDYCDGGDDDGDNDIDYDEESSFKDDGDSSVESLKIKKKPSRQTRKGNKSKKATYDDEDYEPSFLDESSSDESVIKKKKSTYDDDFIVSDNDISFQGDEECSSDESIKPKNKRKPKKKMCSSKHDAITEEELEHPHICWESPNKSMKQCFNLSTLIRVANAVSSGKKDFMQPPHFRCAMDMDLRQQICDKFGSKALSLDDDDEEEDNEGEGSFTRRLERYLYGVMGSSDLYLCPLCYSEAYRRYISTNSRSHPSEHSYHSFHFQHDPISVLQNLDDQLHIASTFSFRKMSEVKAHMKQLHNIKTNDIDNALFNRFKIRTSDGLLQRYLEHLFKREVDNRDMAHFWQDGNNVHFIHLLHLVESEFQSIPMSFTFSNDMWYQLSSPYLKRVDRDDEEFVVHDEEIQYLSSDVSSNVSSDDDRDDNPELSLIKELRRRRLMKELRRRRGRRGINDNDNAILYSDDEDEPSDQDYSEKQHETKIVSISPLKSAKRNRQFIESSDDSDEDIPKLKRKTPFIDSESEDEIPIQSSSCKLTQILSSDDEIPIKSSRKKQICTSDDDDSSSNDQKRQSSTFVYSESIDSQIDSFLQEECLKLNNCT